MKYNGCHLVGDIVCVFIAIYVGNAYIMYDRIDSIRIVSARFSVITYLYSRIPSSIVFVQFFVNTIVR